MVTCDVIGLRMTSRVGSARIVGVVLNGVHLTRLVSSDLISSEPNRTELA